MIPKSGYRFFRKKISCSTNKLERDDDSKKSHLALGGRIFPDRQLIYLDHSVSTARFCRVQSAVRRRDDPLRARMVAASRYSRAEARSEAPGRRIELDLAELRAHLVDRDLGCPRGGIEQDHAELLAAVAAEDVDLAQSRGELARQRADDPIPHQMAVGVVHLLEPVEVDHCDAELSARPRAALELVHEAVLEAGMIEQAGQAVALHDGADRAGAL